MKKSNLKFAILSLSANKNKSKLNPENCSSAHTVFLLVCAFANIKFEIGGEKNGAAESFPDIRFQFKVFEVSQWVTVLKFWKKKRTE